MKRPPIAATPNPAIAYMQESTFIERASERIWKCEGLFAESKQYHCLARAKYRGRSKVQIQAYLCAIVQNLKRLLFPLYCRLLTHRWSYSTSIAPIAPSNQLRPPISCKTKNLFALCQQARWVEDQYHALTSSRKFQWARPRRRHQQVAASVNSSNAVGSGTAAFTVALVPLPAVWPK